MANEEENVKNEGAEVEEAPEAAEANEAATETAEVNGTEEVTEAAEETVAEADEAATETAEADGTETVTEPTEATETAESAEDAEATETDGNAIADEAEEATEGLEGETAKDETEEEGGKQSLKNLLIIIVAGVIVIAAAVAVLFATGKLHLKNPYTKDYVDITGQTIGEVADQSGMEYDDFLERFGLPADMPEDTSMNAAEYNIPVGKYAELSGYSFDQLKELLLTPQSFPFMWVRKTWNRSDPIMGSARKLQAIRSGKT